MASFYAPDLSYIHDAGFGGYARGLAPEVVRVLETRLDGFDARVRRRARPLVVEVGCGAGTVARRLTEAGFDVIGVDISRTMLRLARERAPNATFRAGSWATMRPPACEVIVAIGEIFSYAAPGRAAARTHERDLRSFFARAFAALEAGGLLLFDFIASHEGRTYDAKQRSGSDWTIEMQARANRSGTMITRRLATTRSIRQRIRRSFETHHVRIYTPAQMRAMLRDAGFEVELSRQIGRKPVFRGNVAAIGKRPG